MEFHKTNLPGVVLIKPDCFDDHRGEYVELYNKELFAKNGIDVAFVQDDISISSQGVLRGIHADRKTWKLVSCLLGKFYLVIVQCDEKSRHFGTWQSFTLTERNKYMVLVPPKHGVAHLALSEKIMFYYKQSSYYDPARQATYRYDDPRFGIWWPKVNPILSRRDDEGRYVR